MPACGVTRAPLFSTNRRAGDGDTIGVETTCATCVGVMGISWLCTSDSSSEIREGARGAVHITDSDSDAVGQKLLEPRDELVSVEGAASAIS